MSPFFGISLNTCDNGHIVSYCWTFVFVLTVAFYCALWGIHSNARICSLEKFELNSLVASTFSWIACRLEIHFKVSNWNLAFFCELVVLALKDASPAFRFPKEMTDNSQEKNLPQRRIFWAVDPENTEGLQTNQPCTDTILKRGSEVRHE